MLKSLNDHIEEKQSGVQLKYEMQQKVHEEELDSLNHEHQ